MVAVTGIGAAYIHKTICMKMAKFGRNKGGLFYGHGIKREI
jgi:hypothetical protein